MNLSDYTDQQLRDELDRRKTMRIAKYGGKPFVKDKLEWAKGKLAEAEKTLSEVSGEKPKNWRQGKTKDGAVDKGWEEVNRWKRIVANIEKERAKS